MDLERPFLESIAETPDDDAPRLIFADWLEDNGHEARARYIRNECASARGSGPARDGWDKEGQDAWRAVLPRLEGGNWKYERGIPEGAVFIADMIDPITCLLNEAELVFSVPMIGAVWLCYHIPYGRAEEGYGQNRVVEETESRALADLQGFKQVHRLSFDGISFSPRGWSILVNSPSLSRLSALDLWVCPLSDGMLAALLDSPLASRLKTLCLRGADDGMPEHWVPTLDSDGVADLAATPSLTSLQRLDIRGHELLSDDPRIQQLRQRFREVIH